MNPVVATSTFTTTLDQELGASTVRKDFFDHFYPLGIG